MYKINQSIDIVASYISLPYSGNVWRGVSLANEHNFAKLKAFNRHLHVTYQLYCT